MSHTSPTLFARVHQELLDRGGMAGNKHLARVLTSQTNRPIRPRQIRDLLRHTGDRIRPLGAGYFALTDTNRVPVLRFAQSLIARGGSTNATDLVSAILSAYPLGCRQAVRAWLFQDPGRLTVVDGIVRLAPILEAV